VHSQAPVILRTVMIAAIATPARKRHDMQKERVVAGVIDARD